MSKHSNREKEIMLWLGKNYPSCRVFRFDNGHAYALYSVKAALQEYKQTKSITLAMKKLVRITYGVNGWPDLLVLYYGVAFGIEVKVGKDRQREDQKNMENTFNLCGAAYRLVTDKQSIEAQVSPVMEKIKQTMEKIWQD